MSFDVTVLLLFLIAAGIRAIPVSRDCVCLGLCFCFIEVEKSKRKVLRFDADLF